MKRALSKKMLREESIIKKWGNPFVDNLVIAKGSCNPFSQEKETLLSLAINRKKAMKKIKKLNLDK